MIERAIHEVINNASIADAVALLALLPAARIVTGTHHDRDLPYASIGMESNGPEYRSNDGGQRRYLVRIQVWHEDHAAGVAIRTAFEKLFENKTFSTTQAELISTRHANSLSIEESDGVWQFLIDIEIVGTPKE